MNLSKELGYVVFFAAPLLLWMIAILVTKRKGRGARAFAFIAGSDNRLSLARLQALAWTLVIFGSFAAAMVVHNPSQVRTSVEQKKKADEAVGTAKLAEADAKKAAAEKNDADEKAEKAAGAEKNIATSTQASADDKVKAKTDAENARKVATTKAEDLIKKNDAVTKAKNAADQAEQEVKAAILKAEWIDIPGALLMLAGIAIGSGVFSSLISALNGEDKTARVTEVEPITAEKLKKEFPEAKLPTPSKTEAPEAGVTEAPITGQALLITGKDFGANGAVRLGRGGAGEESAPVLFWSADGTNVVVDVSDFNELTSLTMETPNGKLWHKLNKKLELGEVEPHYELADLFRDDKNPNGLDLMKFQMFGWTVIAIVIYSCLFLADLHEDMESLPLVPQSIVVLTGLSQAGYLTGKGVSNVGPNEKK
jgi:hypothetical protein